MKASLARGPAVKSTHARRGGRDSRVENDSSHGQVDVDARDEELRFCVR